MTTPTDNDYMLRAYQLARLGLDNTSPNPCVGAVIVARGRIIGEGSHRRIGQPHAEVNAIRSVAPDDRHLLTEATIYVTLEPCSHYGKTPPCAELITKTGIPRVVVASPDPSPKVNGKGIRMLREAGIEVTVMNNHLTQLCDRLNAAFNAPYTLHRPLVTLKWAQSADGFMAGPDGQPVRFSTPLTSTLVHKLRSDHDVILTTSANINADNPLLDCRFWSSAQEPKVASIIPGQRKLPPRIAIIDRKMTVDTNARVFANAQQPPLVFSEFNMAIPGAETVNLNPVTPQAVLRHLLDMGYNSVLVEAGPTFLTAMIREGLYDSIRVELSPVTLGRQGTKSAPALPGTPQKTEKVESNLILTYEKHR